MAIELAAPEAPELQIPVSGPSNGLVSSDALDVAHEVAIAREAQPEWAARPIKERLAIVRRMRQMIPEYAAELAAPIHPTRRVPGETLGAEVLPFADSCRFLEQRAASILKPYRLGARFRPLWLFGARAEVHREPFGVVLLIGPGNYPLFLTASQAVQALVAGNSVVVKPGAGAEAVTRVFAQLMEKAGLDPRLLRVLDESPESAQRAIAAGVDKVLLTGSARTGANVLAQLAPRLVPSAMELSGYDACFVRADADIDLVTKALRFSWRLNHGETCIAPHRIFVAPEVAPELKKRLTALGQEFLARPTCTPAAARAAELVQDALARGAELVAGRILPDNQGLTPTIVANATSDMPLLREETFAPVFSMVVVRDEEEALAAASRCPFGLGATIFGNVAQARALARRIRAGSIVINDVIAPTADPRLPFGGRGHSGFGVTRGTEGLLELTTVKVVSVRKGNNYLHFDGPDELDPPLYDALIRASHSRSWFKRMRALFQVARLFMKKGRRYKNVPAVKAP
jgi:acyl-CoA reductase-like NAD-dependent aldehyde dehydrogenase